MAKVIGPLLSLDARGTFKKALTYTTGVQGQRVRGYKSHRDAQSVGQLLWREYYKTTAAIFGNLSGSEKATLFNSGSRRGITGFNFFTRRYLRDKPAECGNMVLGMSTNGGLTILD